MEIRNGSPLATSSGKLFVIPPFLQHDGLPPLTPHSTVSAPSQFCLLQQNLHSGTK